jgi:hypothetical protein
MTFARLRAADWVAFLAALALLALGLLGVIAFACAVSVRAEEQGTEFRELRPAADPPEFPARPDAPG